VGAKKFENNDPVFEEIREAGGEFGATTGRPRQVNWIDMDDMIKAIHINGVNKLIINKIDVLENVHIFKSIMGGKETTHDNREEMEEYIRDIVNLYCPSVENVTFSVSPFDI